MNKQIIIVGGANGVGKTTFAHQYKKEYGIDYLGADEIAAELSGSGSKNIELAAGKEFFKRLETYLTKKRPVIIESTLSGLGLLKIIKKFKSNDFFIRIIYVFLDDVDLCKKRIRIRVKKGGHNIPAEDIVRRYHRSLKNFRKVYMPMADTWQILYNGMKRPIEVAIGEEKGKMVFDEAYFNRFLEISK